MYDVLTYTKLFHKYDLENILNAPCLTRSSHAVKHDNNIHPSEWTEISLNKTRVKNIESNIILVIYVLPLCEHIV